VDINREIVQGLLEATRIGMEFAENGMEAVRMFSAAPERYDLIFMDIHMPEVDGYEATRRIRALDCPHARDVPIVAMTANVFREDVERCLAAGMQAHVSKPLDMQGIMEALRRHLPAKPGAPPPGA
jgi:CheY-like chemotaxis protein